MTYRQNMTQKPLIGLTSRNERTLSGGKVISQLAHSYSAAIVRAGGIPLILPIVEEGVEEIVTVLDGLVLTGGEDVNPLLFDEQPHCKLGKPDWERDVFELSLARKWLESRKPLLGICRGMQVLQIAVGGGIVQDIHTRYPHAYKHSQSYMKEYPAHTVVVEKGSLLAEFLEADGHILVNSVHHQSIDEPVLGFRVSACASDGVIEAIEATDGSVVLGVQWHPEAMRDPLQEQLFIKFISAALDVRRQALSEITG